MLKKDNTLIGFMNKLYAEEKIPTDFVYTGKLFYAVYDLMWKNYFQRGIKTLSYSQWWITRQQIS